MLLSLLCVLLYIIYLNKWITVQNHFHNLHTRFCINQDSTLISVGKKPSHIHETCDKQNSVSHVRLKARWIARNCESNTHSYHTFMANLFAFSCSEDVNNYKGCFLSSESILLLDYDGHICKCGLFVSLYWQFSTLCQMTGKNFSSGFLAHWAI